MASSKLEHPTAPDQPHILAPGQWIWGILQDMGTPQGDLLPVRIQDVEALVGSEVADILRPLVGRVVVVMARKGRYFAGEVTEPEMVELARRGA